MNTFELILYGTLIVSSLQFGLWLYYRATDNAAWVDVGWAYGLGLIVVFYACFGSGSLTSRPF
jgi:steroid 5-alpha reductase family enzyme